MKYSVLVVDDEESIRTLYKLELEDEGYNVHLATCGEEVFTVLGSANIHVIVLDIKLRGESGLQILKEISKRYEHLPVILSTAYSSFREEFSSWLAEAYVVKSSSLDELKHQVSRILERNYGAGVSH